MLHALDWLYRSRATTREGWGWRRSMIVIMYIDKYYLLHAIYWSMDTGNRHIKTIPTKQILNRCKFRALEQRGTIRSSFTIIHPGHKWSHQYAVDKSKIKLSDTPLACQELTVGRLRHLSKMESQTASVGSMDNCPHLMFAPFPGHVLTSIYDLPNISLRVPTEFYLFWRSEAHHVFSCPPKSTYKGPFLLILPCLREATN